MFDQAIETRGFLHVSSLRSGEWRDRKSFNDLVCFLQGFSCLLTILTLSFDEGGFPVKCNCFLKIRTFTKKYFSLNT